MAARDALHHLQQSEAGRACLLGAGERLERSVDLSVRLQHHREVQAQGCPQRGVFGGGHARSERSQGVVVGPVGARHTLESERDECVVRVLGQRVRQHGLDLVGRLPLVLCQVGEVQQ
jgi:hypothetical protein